MAKQKNLPPYAILVTHPVADFDAWKAGFDNHEAVRREVTVLAHHISRGQDDPNLVTIFLPVEDLDRARAFTDSDDLADIMKAVGVTGPPDIDFLEPVREDAVWDRQLPAFILSHRVADFDAWLEGYGGADEFRRSKGIIGHAANRLLDDPAVAVVYHQAESFDDLRAFLDEPELKEVMNEAGVISEPDVRFVTGGWAKRY